MNMHNIPHITKEVFTKYRAIITILVSLIFVLAIFEAGVSVGYRKASFSYGSGDNFYRVFGERPMMGEMVGTNAPRMIRFGDALPGGHGTVGRVVSVDGASFIVASPDNMERIISTDGKTEIRYGRATVDFKEVKPGVSTIVLGSPDNSGRIQARLVRIMPTMPAEITFTATATMPAR